MTTVYYLFAKTDQTVTATPLEAFIITTFCLIDDLYRAQFSEPIRKRGFPAKLSDSEVITMEIVAEWQGIHGYCEVLHFTYMPSRQAHELKERRWQS